jgi:hypothetical protein
MHCYPDAGSGTGDARPVAPCGEAWGGFAAAVFAAAVRRGDFIDSPP